MPMIVADELEADWKRVRVVQAPGDEKRFGNQDTDGSRSTRHFFEPMRRCGAAARTMLEAAAAKRWGVPVERGGGQEPRGRARQERAGAPATASLAKAAAQQPVPARDTVRLKDPSKFRYIGKGKLKLVDGPDIVTGKAQYGIDTRLPGMLYAVVARPPVYGGKVVSVDAAEALKVPGRAEGGGDRAEPGARPVQSAGRRGGGRAQHLGGHPGPPGAQGRLGRRAERQLRLGGLQGRDGGVRAQARQGRARQRQRRRRAWRQPRRRSRPSTTSRTWRTRRWSRRPRRCASPAASARCGAASSRPRPREDLVAKRLGLPPADVTVHVTLLGGGFGRKSKPDFAIEAAVVSKAMEGKPVKLTWTREDDLMHTYFHTVSVEHLEAGVDAQGKPVAWLHRSVAPTHLLDLRRRAPRTRRALELGMGVINVPFAIPNIRIENPEAAAHTRIGWFRVGLQHPARLRGAVVRRRAGRGGGPRPEGLSAGGHRPGAPDQPRKPWRHLEPRRVPGAGTRWTPAGCGAWWRRSRARRAGAGRCPRAAAWASPRTTAS